MAEPEPTATEAAVMRMWSEVLEVRPTSTSDDFFDLGGDSVGLVWFLTQVRDQFLAELPVADLFETEFTVSETARAIERCAGVRP